MPTSTLATVQHQAPSTLVTGQPDAAGPTVWRPSVGVAILIALVGVLGVLLYLSRRRRPDERERAFHAIASRIGLDRRDRARVRALSRSAADPHPVALMVSRGAFQRAASTADKRLARALPALEQRLFGLTPARVQAATPSSPARPGSRTSAARPGSFSATA